MKNNFYYFTIGLTILAIVLSGCQGPAAAEAATLEPETMPEPTAFPTATEAPPEIISQWAVSARADAEPVIADPNWGHATGAIGEPDVTDCDVPGHTAWTVGTQEGLAILEVFYEETVIPSEINIIEPYGGNQVVKVELLDVDGSYHEVPTEAAKKQFTCIYTLNVPVEDSSYKATGVRITVDPSVVRGDWAQVDAVELVGQSTGEMVEVPESQGFVEPPLLGERAYYDRPDDFPNTYQIHVVYLLANDNADRERDINGQLNKSFKLANEWMAAQTGGQTFRFDTYQGEPDVTFVQLEETESEINSKVELNGRSEYIIGNQDFQLKAYPRPGKLYIVIAEFEQHDSVWGLSTGYGYMFVYPRAVKSEPPALHDYAYGFEFTVLHELVHEFGFVQSCGLNYHKLHPLHVSDDNADLMWTPDDPYAEFYFDVDHTTLDVGNDDYFNHNIPNCPDLADSAFLTPTSEDPMLPGWLNKAFKLPE